MPVTSFPSALKYFIIDILSLPYLLILVISNSSNSKLISSHAVTSCAKGKYVRHGMLGIPSGVTIFPSKYVHFQASCSTAKILHPDASSSFIRQKLKIYSSKFCAIHYFNIMYLSLPDFQLILLFPEILDHLSLPFHLLLIHLVDQWRLFHHQVQAVL